MFEISEKGGDKLMKTRKIKGCLVLLVILIFSMSTSGIAAMEKNKTDPGLQGQEDQDMLELIEWKGVIANSETGESIEINSKDNKQLVSQSADPQLVYFNDDTGEKQYYQEIIISLPENVVQNGYGTLISGPMTDENNGISVVLGMRYSTGDSGIYEVIRIDGVYVNWQITDPTVRLTDVELGYRIMNGIGVENGAVNELMLWDLETDANSYETERIAPSPWFLWVKDFVHSETIFSGNLINENGETRSMVMEFDLGFGL